LEYIFMTKKTLPKDLKNDHKVHAQVVAFLFLT